MILKRLQEIRPNRVLDVGCGCGSYTAMLSEFCGSIEAIDPMPGLIERCKVDVKKANINFRVMDAVNLSFEDNYFDTVVERGSLHHIGDWQQAVREMVRVSDRYVLIEERVNDPRSEGKKIGIKAQDLFLEVQREVKYPHFPYISPELIVNLLESKKLLVQWEVVPSESVLSFDEFFEGYDRFANKSARPSYWMERLESLRKEIGTGQIIESDTVFFAATKT